jgi:hypothetical protein
MVAMKKRPVTLRDFLTSSPKLRRKEPEYYTCFSARLRIVGKNLDFDKITQTLGIKPSHSHKKGGKWKVDMWSYKAPVERTRPLDEHIMAIWEAVKPRMAYLRRLKKKYKVDMLCGFQTNSCTGGFEVNQRCLGFFSKLDIPFGVSVIIV